MRSDLKIAASLLLVAGLAGCDSIGDGNTVERLDLLASPSELDQAAVIAAGTATESLKMYDCFCSNLTVSAIFTDGTLANFIFRAKFTSSDPAVVEVVDAATQSNTPDCPLSQQLPGLLVPRGVGQATISAEFAGLKDTYPVEVLSTAAEVQNFALGPADAQVAVGADLALLLRGTLDGRTRVLNRNALSWTLDPVDETIATINTTGTVHGVAPTGATPVTALAAFPTCSLNAQTSVRIGDVVDPLTVEREDVAFASDALLAVNSDEALTVTAALDFGAGGALGSQIIGSQVALTYTDTCTLREFDATAPPLNCKETVGAGCTNATPVCTAASTTACPSGMTPCRTTGSPLIALGLNRIVGVSDNGSPTHFTATFPSIRGSPTTLAANLTDTATTLTVTALVGYPQTFPYNGIIDGGGAREDVRVIGANGATLTVVRGLSGTTAQAHSSGDTFVQRSYSSTAPLSLTAKQGTLTTVAVDPPGALPALDALQLHAQGTFVDSASNPRQQRVTRLTAFTTGAPAVDWTSSDLFVARVGVNTGLVTSATACGGEVTIRARSSTSTDATTFSFDPETTADDDACENTDPLCDQVELCIDRFSTLPAGVTCSDPAPVCP